LLLAQRGKDASGDQHPLARLELGKSVPPPNVSRCSCGRTRRSEFYGPLPATGGPQGAKPGVRHARQLQPRLRPRERRAEGGGGRAPTTGAALPYLSTIFQYESFFTILPARNANRSTPRTRTRSPVFVVPVNSQVETPRLPATQWVSSL